MTSRSSTSWTFRTTQFHLNGDLRGPVIVERLCYPGGLVTLPNLKPLLSFARALEAESGKQFKSVPLSGPEGNLSIQAEDLLAFVARLRECYPSSKHPDVPEFYQLTNELRWLSPNGAAWQPMLALQQKWEHRFGFEPDVWLSVPTVPGLD